MDITYNIYCDSLVMALSKGMPNRIEYKVMWLRQKVSYLQECIKYGLKRLLRSWHGTYGWRYESTLVDKEEFEYIKRVLSDCQTQLHDLEKQTSDSNKNEWYWNETF